MLLCTRSSTTLDSSNQNFFFISRDSQSVYFLFQFKNLLLESPLASHYLQGELTIFAPSDRAMRKYTGPKDDNFILNHMGQFVNYLCCSLKTILKQYKPLIVITLNVIIILNGIGLKLFIYVLSILHEVNIKLTRFMLV